MTDEFRPFTKRLTHLPGRFQTLHSKFILPISGLLQNVECNQALQLTMVEQSWSGSLRTN